MINLFQPNVGPEELAAVGEAFSSNWLGAGPRLQQFEAAFADFIGQPSSQVLSVSCCTEGLFQAVAALGLGPGDDVILPSISFIGAAHAVRSAGARVVPCDVDPMTLNPRIGDIEQMATGTTKAILLLHYGGRSGSLAEVAAFARSRGIALIEDSACSLGAALDGRACGTFGDIGVWSFDAMKILTTGDGGMVWCRDVDTAARIRDTIALGGASSGFAKRATEWWWEVEPAVVGRRATMNDMAAALGLVQLERLPSFLARRRQVAGVYDDALADLSWLRLPPPAGASEAPIFYWVQLSKHRDALAKHLLDRGVYVSFRYWPLHKTRLYGSGTALPGAEHAAASTLLLPLHQGLSDADVDQVVDGVRSFKA